jgi:YD repeat-containing protein
VLLCLINFVIYAQPSNDYLPATPTAAGLGKYVDAPINLSTGTPGISIPIYEIVAGSFKLPISLTYHAGGFRVEEDASWVGLGWSLQAGGVISRTIRGKVDDGVRDDFFDTYEGNDLDENNSDDYRDLIRLSQSSFDGMPDLYIYNFPGHSGKFININGVKLLPKEPIIITSTSHSFKVVDQSGNTYIFSETESAKTRSTTSASVENTSWYLSKIATPTNDTIDFHYKTTRYFQQVNISESKTYKKLPTLRWDLQTVSSNFFLTTVYGKELERITWSQGSITFISQYDRKDIDKPQGTVGALRLTKIKVEDRQGRINKMFHLSHDYFGPANSTDFMEKRLKLLSVVEDLDPIIEQETNGDLKAYKFEYATGKELPRKDSKDQDHWGYFNNKGNSSLVPPLYTGPGSTVDQCGSESSIDLQPTRATDTTYVRACLLTKITYPTGGYAKYDYESHDYGFVSNSAVPLRDIKINRAQRSELVSAYTNRSEFIPSTRSTHSEFFALAQEQCVKIWINIEYPPEWIDGSQSQAKIELWEASGAGGEPTPLVAGSPIETYHLNQNGDNFLLLPPGEYEIRAIGTMIKSKAHAIIYYEDYDIVTTRKKYAGGVRVKRVTEGDGFGPEIIRKITYYNGNNPNISSGNLLEEPNYYRWHYQWQAPEGEGTGMACIFNQTDYLTLLSSSQTSLGAGSHISYKEVQVLYGETGENGKNISTFSISPNLTHGTESDVSWRRGILVTSGDYDNTNFRLRFTKNDYNFITAEEYYGLGVEDTGSHPCADNTYPDVYPDVYPIHVRQTVSKLSSEFYALTKTTSQEFNKLTGGVIENTVEYFYDNVTHLQITRTKTNANNKRLVTAVSYPADYADASGFVGDLKASNIIVPLESVTWQEGFNEESPKILSGQLFIYRAGGTGLIEETKALEIASPLPFTNFKFSNRSTGVLPPNENETPGGYLPFISYVSKVSITYDDNLNPVQVIPKNGNPTSYIWGYQNEFVIAKATNAIPTKIAYAGFENHDEGNWDSYTSNSNEARTGTKAFVGTLVKSNLPSDNYTLTLWVKDGTGTPSVAGTAPIETSEVVNGWKLLRWETSLAGQLVISSNGSIIDDVCLHPVNSMMTTISYDPLKGPVCMTDPNNITTYYEYDRVGRLKLIKDLDGNVVKHFLYNYKDPVLD